MSATTACLCIAATYVAPLYLWADGPRNEPGTIMRRMGATLACCCVAWVPLWLSMPHDTSSAALLRLLGLRADTFATAAVSALGATAVLYAGPLLMALLDHDPADRQAHRAAAWGSAAKRRVTALIDLRNLVVAPLSEEFVFRGCMLPLLLLEGVPPARAVLTVPLFFGLAHLHHLHELVVHQGARLQDAALMVLFQAAFTTVFGWFAALLLVRTGNLAAPFVAHVFCNWMGLPALRRLAAHRQRWLLLPVLWTGICGFLAALRTLGDADAYKGGLPAVVREVSDRTR